MKIDIALAIIQNDSSFLFQLRNKEPYKNMLGLLGGKKGEEEDLVTALNREVFEESGLRLVNLKPIGIVSERYQDKVHVYDMNLHVFHANCSGTIKHNKEEGEVLWISVEKFKSLKKNFIPSDWLIVENFLKKSFKDFSLSVFKSNKTYSYKITS